MPSVPLGAAKFRIDAPAESWKRSGEKSQPIETTHGTVFISHSSKDSSLAKKVYGTIEQRGFECWFAPRDVKPGENFQESIHRAIRSASVMILVFTDNANHSAEITKEIALAGQYNLAVIPIRAEDVLPNDALAYELATRQWIDLFGNWDHGVERLCARIAGIIASSPAKT